VISRVWVYRGIQGRAPGEGSGQVAGFQKAIMKLEIAHHNK